VKSRAEQVQETAGRAVLIPVGAALSASDRVLETVGSVRRSYGSPQAANRQLKKFERRGITARNKVERELKRNRTRVEREVRQRRKQVTKQVRPLSTQVETVAVQVENAVQSGVTASSKAAQRTAEGVAGVA